MQEDHHDDKKETHQDAEVKPDEAHTAPVEEEKGGEVAHGGKNGDGQRQRGEYRGPRGNRGGRGNGEMRGGDRGGEYRGRGGRGGYNRGPRED